MAGMCTVEICDAQGLMEATTRKCRVQAEILASDDASTRETPDGGKEAPEEAKH